MLKKIMAIALLAFTFCGVARADLLHYTLPEYSFDGSAPYPESEQTVGIFAINAPVGHTIVSAIISGFWGNEAYPYSTAGADVMLDGLLVAQCADQDPGCWWNDVAPRAWSYTLTSDQFAQLHDGFATLTVTQTSDYIVRLGSTSLTIETIAVPEAPAITFILMGFACFATMRRNRS
jgi:hypothetical protein